MRSLLLAALLALGACASAKASPVVAKPVVVGPAAAMIAKTYRVTIDCGEGGKPGGTAVDLGGGYLATAKHVIEGDELCQFMLDQEGVERAPVASFAHRKHVGLDLGLLYAPEFAGHQEPEMCTPELGSTLFAVGYPRGPNDRIQRLTVTRGVLATNATWDGEARIDAPIFFGNSGGGAWAESGCLVGITVSGYMELDGWYFIVPSDRIADLI